jgi:hypothetical protein
VHITYPPNPVADLREGAHAPSYNCQSLDNFYFSKKKAIKEPTFFSIVRNIENNVFNLLLLLKGELIFQS